MLYYFRNFTSFWREGDRLATVKELAILAETSVATVSRVINGNAHVSETTRKRVLEAIFATGYAPQKTTKATDDEILVILPSLNNPYFQEILRGVEHKAISCGFSTYSCVTHRNAEIENRYIRAALSGNRAKGIIVVTSTLSDHELDALSLQLPMVLCGSTFSVSNVSFVCIDDRQASYDAISFLVQSGNSKIAMISSNLETMAFVNNRHIGYMDALRDYSIPYVPDYDLSCDNSYSDGYECAKQLFRLQDPPTAVFAFSEFTAIGVLKYMSEHGIVASRDVDVLGFDGTQLSEYSNPQLSVIQQPAYNIGKLSFEILLDRITDPDNYVQRHIVLSHKLIPRKTTKAQL